MQRRWGDIVMITSYFYVVPVRIAFQYLGFGDGIFVGIVAFINLWYHRMYEQCLQDIDVIAANVLVGYNFIMRYALGWYTFHAFLVISILGIACVVFMMTTKENYDRMHSIWHLLTIIGMSVLYRGV